MNKYVKLARPWQWYKNLVVFLAVFFTGNILNPGFLLPTLLGFTSLALASSSGYALNDVWDADSDRAHPEKKKRPVASGEVSKTHAVVFSLILLAVSLLLAFVLSRAFLLMVLLLYLLTLAYTFSLKNIAFIDIHLISLNFLVRAVSGAVLIGVPASPWLVSTVFFLALLLALSKRRVELDLLGGDAKAHKGVYEVYTKEMLDNLMQLVAAVLLINYSLYTFMVHPEGAMMITIPFATFIVFRYLYLAESNHKIARKTHLLFTDRQIMTAFACWLTVSFLVMHTVI